MGLYKKLILFLAFSSLVMASTLWIDRELESKAFPPLAIPATLGPWRSVESPVSDLEKDILETNQVFGRRYFGSDGSFHLSMVYYPNGVVNFHHPEYCTRAVGAQLSHRQPIALEGGWPGSRGTYFQVVETNGRITHYVYAFCTPYEAHGEYLAFRLHLAKASLRSGRTACALIRLSATGSDSAKVRQDLVRFWEQLSVPLRKGFAGHDTGAGPARESPGSTQAKPDA